MELVELARDAAGFEEDDFRVRQRVEVLTDLKIENTPKVCITTDGNEVVVEFVVNLDDQRAATGLHERTLHMQGSERLTRLDGTAGVVERACDLTIAVE